MSSRGTRRVKVAIGQMTSTGNKIHNFQVCSRLAKEAAAAGATFLALPECFNFLGGHWMETIDAAEPLSGPSMVRYRNLAKEHGLWLSLGGFQETAGTAIAASGSVSDAASDAAGDRRDVHAVASSESEGPGPDSSSSSAGKVFNTHVIISGTGDILAAYRKIHLFDVDVPGGAVLKESRFTKPGRDIVICKDTPAGHLGLSTCYDVRFPEMYACLAAGEAQVILVPSAFTMPTGRAHWEVLLRARAIETQAYVIAAAQVGKHNEKRESYGHSLVVDPWGRVLADAGKEDSPCIRVAEIDFDELEKVRERMPIREHRQAAGSMFAQQLLEEVDLPGKSSL